MGEMFAGRYELADPIGRGGVGSVWRAWDHRRHRYVAAKVLRQSDAHALLRFVREQGLRFDHPHVLAPESWAADDDQVLFTMGLVRGGSLAHLVGDYGPLPPQFVCVLLDQLLSGLASVHAEGVVHRDIKPANLLLEATGTGRPHLRVADFGIALHKGEARLTDTDFVVGTPGWFAPEQMLGAEPDFPADLYAVGLVALYLLSGSRPDIQGLVERFTQYGTPRAPQDVPAPLWEVLGPLLQPDPQARFRTATGARKALATAAALLPEPGPDDELIEVFDQLGPLPTGFGPEGPEPRPSAHADPVRRPGPLPPPPSGLPSRPAEAAPAPPAAPAPHTATGPSSAPTGFGPAPEVFTAASAAAATPAQPVAQPPVPPPPTAPPHPHLPPEGIASAPAPAEETTSDAPLPPSVPTRPYTVQGAPQYQVMPPLQPSAPVHRRARRPGPPAKVAIPVLLLALVCFATGAWALVQGGA
ncbi:serine/threonine-protein kinase [Streptomyces sp. NPDC049954]|uniref:serine/threonine-protein kinase n=1 Tax=Streptomyces sp. NPDC049954 TaxID=3155779 RepID=UPI00342EFF5C